VKTWRAAPLLPAGQGVVEGASACFQPTWFADRYLHRPSEACLSATQRGIDLIAVRVAEDKNVDVSDGPGSRLSFVPGRPRSVDVGFSDSRERP